jgi:hypothetical protein
MKLRKDDPVYYKLAFNSLIKQAYKEGLKVSYEVTEDYEGLINGIRIYFKSDNGDTALVDLTDN